MVLKDGARPVDGTGVEGSASVAHGGKEGARRADIVVITDREDAHVPLVQAHMSRELIVVDPLQDHLTFERGSDRRAATTYAGLLLSEVRSVWYRKPLLRLRPLVEFNVAAEHRRYSRLAMGAHGDLLMASFGDAYWVSDPYTIERAESKALQLELAAELGMLVPETVITNDPRRAAEFMASRPAMIVKPLCAPGYAGGSTQSFLAVRIHDPSELTDGLSGLRWAPAIFQQAIDAIADFRVTVVGDNVFSARIDADPATVGKPGVRDWRHRELVGEPLFRADQLPPRARCQCLALTRALGLEYAAFDLVVDARGDLWFLELNPNGQWGFIELEAGLPIGAALAELLSAP